MNQSAGEMRIGLFWGMMRSATLVSLLIQGTSPRRDALNNSDMFRDILKQFCPLAALELITLIQAPQGVHA